MNRVIAVLFVFALAMFSRTASAHWCHSNNLSASDERRTIAAAIESAKPSEVDLSWSSYCRGHGEAEAEFKLKPITGEDGVVRGGSIECERERVHWHCQVSRTFTTTVAQADGHKLRIRANADIGAERTAQLYSQALSLGQAADHECYVAPGARKFDVRDWLPKSPPNEAELEIYEDGLTVFVEGYVLMLTRMRNQDGAEVLSDPCWTVPTIVTQ